jgi:hypothetical protein
LINSLYNAKSKEIKVSKTNFNKIFKELEANFFVEVNVNSTSILKHLNKSKNSLIHFSCPFDATTFRDIRDDLKSIIKNIKNIKIDKQSEEDYNGEHDSLTSFVKKYIEYNSAVKKITIKEISSQITELSELLKEVFISSKNSLDVLKAFNEKDNLIIIHLDNCNYQAFFKIHGNFLMFHKAKIILIGNEIAENTVYLKKYGFRSLHKKLTKNTIWCKNF